MMAVVKPKETAYKSAYSTAIDDLVNKAINREAFQYDPATDAAYQSYARQYTRLGNEAAQNTLADVAAQTGGIASSYAVTAAQQARDQYNQALTDKIPALMEAAYNKYRADYNDTLAGISTLQGVDDSMYNRYATDRSYNRGVYESDRDYAEALREWNKQFNRNVYESNRNYNYQKSRDKVADSQWNKEFNRSKYESDRNYNYQKSRDKVADSQWLKEFNYRKERDTQADRQWTKEFNENVRQFDKNYELDKNSKQFEKMLNTWSTLGYASKAVADYFGIEKGTKTNEASYQAAQLALQKAQMANGSSGGGSGRRSGGGRRRSGRSYRRSGYRSNSTTNKIVGSAIATTLNKATDFTASVAGNTDNAKQYLARLGQYLAQGGTTGDKQASAVAQVKNAKGLTKMEKLWILQQLNK